MLNEQLSLYNVDTGYPVQQVVPNDLPNKVKLKQSDRRCKLRYQAPSFWDPVQAVRIASGGLEDRFPLGEKTNIKDNLLNCIAVQLVTMMRAISIFTALLLALLPE
ncbi:Uncharacterized protein DAT39_000477, partial [Clarias magur]